MKPPSTAAALFLILLLVINWNVTLCFPIRCHDCQKTTQLFSSDPRRRELIASTLISALWPFPASAAGFFGRPPKASLYVLGPERNSTDSLQREPVEIEDQLALSSELCLLKLLPIKNPFFRQIQTEITRLSALRNAEGDDWKVASKQLEQCVAELDKRRSVLEPVFNPDDSSLMQITKAERGERLIEALRTRLVELAASTKAGNATGTFNKQKEALLALSEVGELLVASFPYNVPSEQKFSYLPRLLGRTKVTFALRRRNTVLGNVTIMADGFAAPITAGNFVDLSLRNFYTGLPIKFTKKRVGSGNDFEVANLPILGSYQEGFYDPLTAKLRRLPLELIRVEKNSGVPILSYTQGMTPLSPATASVEPTEQSKPLLSFDIPGIVAMNHPESNVDGASSEFFSLQENSMFENKRSLMDGEYAPFGYIIAGFDLFQSLQPGDVIDDTIVDEWGAQNLVKLRQSSFSEAVQGAGS